MQTRILKPTPESIAEVARALLADQIAGMPTETVYGLAGRAFSTSALLKIFQAKERPLFDPLIAHVVSTDTDSIGLTALDRLLASQREQVRKLQAVFWPGPLTLVLPKGERVSDLATSGLTTVGVRLPAHPVAQALIRAVGEPLCAPSANRFGRISPTRAEHVLEELDGRIPWILDGGACAIGVESTVVLPCEDGQFALLRPGGVPREALESVLGIPLLIDLQNHASPGTLESHYAPRTPLSWLKKSALTPDAKQGLLQIKGPRTDDSLFKNYKIEVLSEHGDWAEAAQRLFDVLRCLDNAGLDQIWVERVSVEDQVQSGLAFAIADRLGRAVHRQK